MRPPPARRRQIRRAREVLSAVGWLFDDFVNAEMRKVLVSLPEERDQREEAYRRARVATELKAGLESPDRDLRSGFGACSQAPGSAEGAARQSATDVVEDFGKSLVWCAGERTPWVVRFRTRPFHTSRAYARWVTQGSDAPLSPADARADSESGLMMAGVSCAPSS